MVMKSYDDVCEFSTGSFSVQKNQSVIIGYLLHINTVILIEDTSLDLWEFIKYKHVFKVLKNARCLVCGKQLNFSSYINDILSHHGMT